MGGINLWCIKQPTYGDHIRVSRGLYHHHGIYIDEMHVISFGSIKHELNPKKARVMMTSLVTFLHGGRIEVRVYTKEEETKKRLPNEIVNYALLNLNRAGYDLISNNCEHFANECVFGEPKSDQINYIKQQLDNLFRFHKRKN